METKKPWQSKTNWIALILAIAAFFPDVQAFISMNPDMFAWIISALIVVLRQISKGKIDIKDQPGILPPESK